MTAKGGEQSKRRDGEKGSQPAPWTKSHGGISEEEML
jgi:hypothetical protein